MAGDPVLDVLGGVFPQFNISTLRQVAMEFKDDLDAAAEYIIENFSMLHNSNTNTSGGYQQAFDGTNFHLGVDPVDNNTDPNSVLFDIAENEDSLEQLIQSLPVTSSAGQACLPEESHSGSLLSGSQNSIVDEVAHRGDQEKVACLPQEIHSDSLLASSQNSLVDDEVPHPGDQEKVVHCRDNIIGEYGDGQLHRSSYEKKPGMSASEDGFPLHNDDSPDMTIQSSCSVCLESLDNAIASENYKKICLLSNMAAISEMLEEVEVNEAKTKLLVSEASQAGNDILVKVERLKEMSALAAEENKKVAGGVLAENSIIASEAQGLMARLSNISEERNNFVLIIDEMHNTLQKRLSAVEAEREAAENEKIEREKLAQKSLEEEELFLEAVMEESKKLEQQAQGNAKLRKLLMDRGQVVDALHGEMLQIFDNIAQLKQRLDMQLPVDDPVQLASSSLSPVKLGTSQISWSSALQSNISLNGDEKIGSVFYDSFALDDSWDVVGDETIF